MDFEIMLNKAGHLNKQSRLFLMALGFVLAVSLGMIDYFINPEISFSIFYLLPIFMAVWFVGNWAGVLMAAICSILWFIVESTHGLSYSNPTIPYWNATVRLGFFFVVVFLTSKIKMMNEHLEERVLEKTSSLISEIEERKKVEKEREKLISELQAALEEVKKLSGFLPICASCKKIRDDEGYWNQIEVYISEHSEAEFSHGICPDCAKKLYPDFYDKVFKKEG